MENQNRHPIEGLMQTAMESIKAIVNVNTILGDPVEAPDGTIVVPVSRVSLGFAAGGGEYDARAKGGPGHPGESQVFPFGGGSGAGISVNPVAFLVVGQGQIRLLPVGGNALYDRLVDLAPKLVEQLQGVLSRGARDGGRNGRGGSDQDRDGDQSAEEA